MAASSLSQNVLILAVLVAGALLRPVAAGEAFFGFPRAAPLFPAGLPRLPADFPQNLFGAPKAPNPLPANAYRGTYVSGLWWLRGSREVVVG